MRSQVSGFSNHGAGRAAARYLVGKGHRSLAFIGGTDDRYAARLRGFRDAAAAPGVSGVRELLADAALRAVFCSNDMLAAGVLFECARRRIAVPGQLAVMGFADLPIAANIEPALTSMQVRATDMGVRAGRILLGHLQGDPTGERVVHLGFAVVERASA